MALEFKTLAVDEDFTTPDRRRRVAQILFEGTINDVAIDLTIVLTMPEASAEVAAEDEPAGAGSLI